MVIGTWCSSGMVPQMGVSFKAVYHSLTQVRVKAMCCEVTVGAWFEAGSMDYTKVGQ